MAVRRISRGEAEGLCRCQGKHVRHTLSGETARGLPLSGQACQAQIIRRSREGLCRCQGKHVRDRLSGEAARGCAAVRASMSGTDYPVKPRGVVPLSGQACQGQIIR